MNRKPTRQSRGPNAKERRHIAWIKERGICAACGNDAGVIAHHCEGSTFKVRVGLEQVHIGHAFVIGLCEPCDNMVTRGSRRALTDAYGPQSRLWLTQEADNPDPFDDIITEAITLWGR